MNLASSSWDIDCDHDSFGAFPSYEAKRRLEIRSRVERKLGFLRGVRSVLVLPSNWFSLTRFKWLPLIENSLTVSGIVIAEPGVGATTWSTAYMGSLSIGNYGATCEDEAKRRNYGAKMKTFEENTYLTPYVVSSKEDTAYQH
ncbi:hypothetical protein Tco_1107840 [Tanacetum coccineum]